MGNLKNLAEAYYDGDGHLHYIDKETGELKNEFDMNGDGSHDNTNCGKRNIGEKGRNSPPEPLPELPPVESFDYGFLPANVRDYVKDISERMQCPPDFAAVNTYVMLSTVIGCKIGIRPKQKDNWTVIPNLWGATIGNSGVMKSPVRNEVMKPLKQLQAEIAEDATRRNEQIIKEINAMLAGEKIKKSARHAEAKKRLKENENADISDLVNDDDTELKQEPIPRFLTNNATVEALGELMIENPNGILFEADELIGLLKDLDKQGQEGARAFYLTAADGNQSYTIDRILRGKNLHIDNACLSIVGGIQPGVLGDYVRGALSDGAGADGLLQRFGLMVYPDISPDWKYIDRYPDKLAREVMNDLIRKLHALDVDATAQRDEFSKTPYIRFDDEAQRTFIDWLGELERRLRSSEEHPAIISHLSKYRKLVPSLALINQLCDNTNSRCINNRALLRALAYLEYLETHAKRIYSHGTQPGIDAAKTIISKLNSGKLTSPFTARDVYRNCWAGINTQPKAQQAIDALMDYGHLAEEEVRTGGKPFTFYHWVKS